MAVLKQIKRTALEKSKHSSMALAKGATEALSPWPYQYLRPRIVLNMTVCGVFSHEHAQCATKDKLQDKVAAILMLTGRSSWGKVLYCWLGPSY